MGLLGGTGRTLVGLLGGTGRILVCLLGGFFPLQVSAPAGVAVALGTGGAAVASGGAEVSVSLPLCPVLPVCSYWSQGRGSQWLL